MKLSSLKPRVAVAKTSRLDVPTVAKTRITGYTLQKRRLRMWSQSPVCAECGRVVLYPHGFELDHKVPLCMGGSDTEDNCQILCAGPDGCHAHKTAADLGTGRGGSDLSKASRT